MKEMRIGILLRGILLNTTLDHLDLREKCRTEERKMNVMDKLSVIEAKLDELILWDE